MGIEARAYCLPEKIKTSIVSDTTCDIPKSIRERLNIFEVPIRAYIGGDEIKDTTHLLEEMEKGIPEDDKHKFTTAAPSPYEIANLYKQLPKKQIFSVHLMDGKSATFKNATDAAEDLMKEDNEFEIITFNSRVSMGLGFLAMEGARNSDKSPAEILSIIQEKSERSFITCTFATLEWLYKGGRISRAQYLLGTVLNIKPVFLVNQDFDTESKQKGRKKALNQVIEVVKKQAPLEDVAIVHAGILEEAEEVSEKIKPFYDGEIIITQIGPVVATYGGKGAIGICGVKQKEN